MRFIFHIMLILLMSPVVVAQDATLPYVELYKLCNSFADNLQIKVSCKEKFPEPLKLTIQIGGKVVSAIPQDDQGYIKLPLDEKWVADNAVLHANRPKGSMTLTGHYVVYPFSRFSIREGKVDLMDYLTEMKQSTEKFLQLQKMFKDLEIIKNDNIHFSIDPAEGAKAIVHYTLNGEQKTATFPAKNGLVVVQTGGFLNATAASMTLEPSDAKIVFLQPEAASLSEAEAEKSAPVIP